MNSKHLSKANGSSRLGTEELGTGNWEYIGTLHLSDCRYYYCHIISYHKNPLSPREARIGCVGLDLWNSGSMSLTLVTLDHFFPQSTLDPSFSPICT